MNQTDQLYKKVADLAKGIKQEFLSRGIVIPRRGANGSVRIDDYTVEKQQDGSYTISDSYEIILQGINLAHTAIMIANDLALGQTINSELLAQDKVYGYNYVEEKHYQTMAARMSKRQEWDRVETMKLKQQQAHERAESAKKYVLGNFEKFRRLR